MTSTPEHDGSPVFVRVNPAASEPIYQQVVDAVTRAIASGVAAPGDPLPSMRDLAVELRINLNTVARAYQRLQDLGLVQVRRGVGVFVADGAEVRGAHERLGLLDPALAAIVQQARELGLSQKKVTERLARHWKESQ